MSAVDAVALLAAAGGDYQISRSVRLRSSASAYFNRTFGAGGSQTTWTLSLWYKRGALGQSSYPDIFSTNSSSPNQNNFRWNADDTLVFYVQSSATTLAYLQTAQVFRDPSAWYHIVLTVDTTNATSTDRLRLYINGQRVTAFSSTTYPSQNQTLPYYNGAVAHYLGASSGSSGFNDCYMTEVNFVNAQSLAASSFGETDAVTGVWKPKKYAGTYGTNGFYLNFSDNSAATAAAIGKDYSGNGNNWTPNNISVTAGATYDSMIDVPTMSGAGSNHCTLNPIGFTAFRNARATYANGNLQLTADATSNSYEDYTGTIGVSSGKWYWEMTNTNAASGTYSGFGAGIAWGSSVASVHLNQISTGGGLQMAIYKNNSSSQTSLGVTANSDVYGIALDLDNLTCQFYKNGSTLGSQVTGLTAGQVWLPMGEVYPGSNSHIYNFGQRPFSYTPPTGFKALNTQNLPDATIKKGSTAFDVALYSGGAGDVSVSGLGFTPDFTWLKCRNVGYDHGQYDSVRGATKELVSNTTGAETTQSTGLKSFDSTGFTVGGRFSGAGNSYATWNWKKGAAQGFDIVTYTGNGSSPRDISHSLGVKPSMMIVRDRSAVANWSVYHKNANASPASGRMQLNLTDAFTAASTIWNSTDPTSSVFTVGSGLNGNATTFIAYLFAEVAGFSKFGSYTGNGSTDGPFVYLGFRPRFLMIKNTTNAQPWIIVDTARNTYNQAGDYLQPNSSGAENALSAVSTATADDILSNGFKLRNNASSSGYTNANGDTYIFAAFAENPTKYSLAR